MDKDGENKSEGAEEQQQKDKEKQREDQPEDKRRVCKYGERCYQKNPDHHKTFKHPSKEQKEVKKDGAENNDADSGSGNGSNNNKRKMPENNEDGDDGESGESPKAKKQNTSSDADVDAAANANENAAETDANKPVESKMEVEAESKTEVVPEKNKEKVEKKPEEKKSDDPYAEAKKLINKAFLVSMPDDFYKLYDFCNELKPSDPSTAFKIADLKLVGPYDILSGLITAKTANNTELLTHWRYYYDPPEFQTIIKGNDKEGLHFGYWRDRPSSDPVFVAMNSSEVSHKIKPVAENVFGAIIAYFQERLKKANPFEKTGFSNLLTKLKAYAKKHNINIEPQTAKMKSREKNVVARTIHGAGIVCPYNKKSQVGYRELSVSDNQLLKIIKRMEDAGNDEEREAPRAEIGEVMRLATIAGDECDFGTCLELGHDLFSSGCVHVHNAALAILNIAYNQLERSAFLKIAEAHLKDRKKGCNLSALAAKKSN